MKIQHLQRGPAPLAKMLLLILGITSFARGLLGVTVPPELISAQLNAAELIADLTLKSLNTIIDPSTHLKTIASAEVLKIHHIKSGESLKIRDEIEIEFPGGEINDRGVMFSGIPRPYNGISYKAYLNHSGSESHHRYVVTGFEDGFKPITQLRQHSRNRTDGSNGSGTGPFLYWDSRHFPIPYYISAPSFKNHPDYVTAIENSFKTWRTYNDVLVEFLSFGCNQSTKNENDSLNTIILLTDNWPFDSAAIAVTRNFYVAGTDADASAGMILDSDILLNGKNFSFTTTGQTGSHDVQNILTHEIGHFLGFGHEIATVNEEATMFASATTEETQKRSLHANDIAVLRSAYSGVGKKFENENMHCEVSKNNVGCLSVHSNSFKTNSYWALLLYLVLTLGLGRWIVTRQFISK